MVESSVIYAGGLRTRATHGPSGVEIETDAPRDNRGRGERFSPTDLVATALASCLLTIMGIRARDRGLAIEGARARVEKHMAPQGPRRIARVVVDVEMPAGVPAAEREGLEAAARTCPVAQSLAPAIEIALSLRYPD